MEVGLRDASSYSQCAFCFLFARDASSQLILPPPHLLLAATPPIAAWWKRGYICIYIYICTDEHLILSNRLLASLV